jgi:NAD-dependent SIR2 family protein deacetylase
MKPVFIFGAGATKACGGPLTSQILPDAFRILHSNDAGEIDREQFPQVVEDFLVENFYLPMNFVERRDDDYPPLPLLLSLLDTAIDKKHSFGREWPSEKLVDVRNGLEWLIFALLEFRLRRLSHDYYYDILNLAKWKWGINGINVISTNYDIIIDNAMCRLHEGAFPDYAMDVATEVYRQVPKEGHLFKLHGSLNWLYCPGCQRLDIGISRSGKRFSKVLEELYVENPLEPRYSCHGSECRDCKSFVRPVMITPTRMKDYRNPHISNVWYGAERILRQADKAIIIGYSLPAEDIDVIYLLKRGLQNLHPSDITVVEWDKENKPLHKHEVGQRYRSVFGNIDWHTEGFESWIKAQ